jgi:hypothetical protein
MQIKVNMFCHPFSGSVSVKIVLGHPRVIQFPQIFFYRTGGCKWHIFLLFSYPYNLECVGCKCAFEGLRGICYKFSNFKSF